MFQLNDRGRILLRLKQRHERDKQRYIRMTALLMIDSGFSAAETASALGIDDSTVYRYIGLFNESASIDAYLRLQYRGLNQEQMEILLEELSGTLYRSAGAVAAFIRTHFTVSYSERGVRHLLRRLGFRFKKTRPIPAKADPTEQERFPRRRLLPLLKRVRKQEEPVFFCDAVPQYNTRAAYGGNPVAEDWPVLSTNWRQRLNLNVRSMPKIRQTPSCCDLMVSTLHQLSTCSRRFSKDTPTDAFMSSTTMPATTAAVICVPGLTGC